MVGIGTNYAANVKSNHSPSDGDGAEADGDKDKGEECDAGIAVTVGVVG